MATRQYVGARYVPKIMGQWDINVFYEPLSIVQDRNGSSWTSKKIVPAQTPLSEGEFWAQTGNYNAQLQAYIRAVQELSDEFDDKTDVLDKNFQKRIDELMSEFQNIRASTVNEFNSTTAAKIAEFDAKIAEVNSVWNEWKTKTDKDIDNSLGRITAQQVNYEVDMDKKYSDFTSAVNTQISTNNNLISQFDNKLNLATAGADAGTEVASARFPATSLGTKMESVMSMAGLQGFMTNLRNNTDTEPTSQYAEFKLSGFDVYNGDAQNYPCIYYIHENQFSGFYGARPSGLPSDFDDTLKYICIYYGEWLPWAPVGTPDHSPIDYRYVGEASTSRPRRYVYEMYSLDGSKHWTKENQLTGTNIVSNFVSGEWQNVKRNIHFIDDFDFNDITDIGVYTVCANSKTSHPPIDLADGYNRQPYLVGTLTVTPINQYFNAQILDVVYINFSQPLFPKHKLHFCRRSADSEWQSVDGAVSGTETYNTGYMTLKLHYAYNPVDNVLHLTYEVPSNASGSSYSFTLPSYVPRPTVEVETIFDVTYTSSLNVHYMKYNNEGIVTIAHAGGIVKKGVYSTSLLLI